MKYNNYIVSFCNNKKSVNGKNLIGLISINGQQQTSFHQIQLELPNDIVVKGVTGITYHADKLALAAQGKEPSILFLNYSYEIESIWKLSGIRGIHSILSVEDDLYIVATGQDRIVKTSNGRDFECVWETGENSDTIHINSICKYKTDVLFSAFGTKDKQQLWSSATNGFIESINHNEKLKGDIWHPHSLMEHKDDIFFCNSSNQRVESLNEVVINDLPGYVRGLYLDDFIQIIGSSMGRLISHTTGEKISNIGDKGKLTGDCGVTTIVNNNGRRDFLDLNNFASEIYDIIPLKD